MERRKWLYVALFALTVVALAFFIIIWQSGMASGGIGASQPPQITQSPADAAQVLQTWMAAEWAEDALLTACTLTLTRRAPTEQHWTCQAYSVQRNRVLVALVEEQNVRVLRDVTALYRPTVLSATAWDQNIQQVLRAWWRAGGDAAWNAASTTAVTIHLGMREDSVPAWQLTLENDKLSTLEYWEIHAGTGGLLEHSSTGGQ